MRGGYGPQGNQRIPARIGWGIELAQTGAPGKIVEIGCGAGLACAPLVGASPDSSYVGIDRSAVAKARFEERNGHLIEAGRARFLRADFLDGPELSGASIGLAINVNAFWTRPPDAFAGMRPMLKRDAVLILVFEAPSQEKAGTIAAILDGCAAAGFAQCEGLTLDARTIARIFRRA